MKINELKNLIEKNKTLETFLIFINKDSSNFLVSQYINAIAKNENLLINKINSLYEINSAISLVVDFTQQLNVLYTDEFAEVVDNYSSLKNTIVVCKKVAKAIESSVNEYIVEFPKLVDWQIKDFMKNYCKGIEDDNVDWLYATTNGEIYRIINELDKIKLFNIQERAAIFEELKFNEYTDLCQLTAFELCDSIIKKDKLTILKYFKYKNAIKIDPFYLISLLISKLKQILLVNFNSGITFETIGLTQKQVNAIRYHYKNCSESFIINSLSFLTSIDQKVKSGNFEVNNINEFIICRLLNF